ncbi:MAG: exosortase/archaeosortase family protein [Sedimentisphaerales bacterium]|nr:exosortase/archaeosortase family protein [Sedimentisphaerales bacterium]
MSCQTPGREYRWTDIPASVWLQIAVLVILFGWFFGQDLWGMVNRWTNDSSWSHGFLIPLFSLYFLHQKKDLLLSNSYQPNWKLGVPLLIFLLLLYPLNIVQFKFAYGRPILMVGTLGAMVLFLGGWNLFRLTWLPVGFLFFAIPLPDRLYSQMTIPLRQMAAEVATWVLNLIPDLTATANGVVIDVVYKGQPLSPGLDVAEACSGMRLLMAFVALGVAMAYLHERPIWQRMVLLLSTIPIAILCNVVRVTITGLIYILWNPEYAKGIYHDMLGLMMLPLAFGFYGILAWLMGNLYTDEEEVQSDLIIRRIESSMAKEPKP